MTVDDQHADGDTEGAEHGSDGDGGTGPFDGRVERAFTCTLCGYATVQQVAPLRGEVHGVCVNCGDWTNHLADRETLVGAAREAAAALAGPVLTERQALAYLLRDVMGADRSTVAEAMDSSPSNVDNLQRRAAEKVADAERVLDGLAALREGVTDGDDADDDSDPVDSDADDADDDGDPVDADDADDVDDDSDPVDADDGDADASGIE